MRDPVTVYVALGANLGDAAATVCWAIDQIGHLPHTDLVRRSVLYVTAPFESSGPDYINAVVEIRTRLAAPDLLLQLQAVERQGGRERPYRNAPRTLDLDVLLYGGARISSPQLQVPHPRMYTRAFVVVPLAEISSNLVSADELAAVQGQSCRPLAA